MFTSIRNWWRSQDPNCILVNVLAGLIVFSASSDINNVNIGISLGLAGAYILYHCIFHIEVLFFLGLFFLLNIIHNQIDCLMY